MSRAAKVDKGWAATKKRAANLEGKLGDAEVRLAQLESVILARDKEVFDLKEAVRESEEKFYNMVFANSENSNEPIMLESRHYRFREGWMVAVNALDTLKTLFLGTLIRFPTPSPRLLFPSRPLPRMKRKTTSI